MRIPLIVAAFVLLTVTWVSSAFAQEVSEGLMAEVPAMPSVDASAAPSDVGSPSKSAEPKPSETGSEVVDSEPDSESRAKKNESANGKTPSGEAKKKKPTNKAPSNTTEIPRAVSQPEPKFRVDPDPPQVRNEIAAYQDAQNPANAGIPNLHSLNEFVSEMTEQAPFGAELREDRAKLSSGEEVTGLAVMTVAAASPAAKAGLQAYNGTAHSVLEGATVAAALFFPPAIIALMVVDQAQVGESFDLIIGVDGKRVANIIDFDDEMKGVKPGDRIYLSVLRAGARVQVTVELPPESKTN
jgi:hypothetical protein